MYFDGKVEAKWADFYIFKWQLSKKRKITTILSLLFLKYPRIWIMKYQNPKPTLDYYEPTYVGE